MHKEEFHDPYSQPDIDALGVWKAWDRREIQIIFDVKSRRKRILDDTGLKFRALLKLILKLQDGSKLVAYCSGELQS